MTALHSYDFLYDGVVYRSRNEAKWASFMSILGWKYEYEPFDLKHYIPDFVLSLGSNDPQLQTATPILEVKGSMSLDQLDYEGQRYFNIAWYRGMILVGATLFYDHECPQIGLYYDGGVARWVNCFVFLCSNCAAPRPATSHGCLVCGTSLSTRGHKEMRDIVKLAWKNAINHTQYQWDSV